MPGSQPKARAALDAAITIVGTGGMRALTHRAIDARAGLPTGSASNYFRTREALIAAVADRLAEQDRALWARLHHILMPADANELAAALARHVGELTGPGRILSIARHALLLEAAMRPQLRAKLTAAAAEIASWSTRWLEMIGSRDPAAHSAVVLAYIDGAVLRQLAFPDPGADLAGPLRMIIHGLLAP